MDGQLNSFNLLVYYVVHLNVSLLCLCIASSNLPGCLSCSPLSRHQSAVHVSEMTQMTLCVLFVFCLFHLQSHPTMATWARSFPWQAQISFPVHQSLGAFTHSIGERYLQGSGKPDDLDVQCWRQPETLDWFPVSKGGRMCQLLERPMPLEGRETRVCDQSVTSPSCCPRSVDGSLLLVRWLNDTKGGWKMWLFSFKKY